MGLATGTTISENSSQQMRLAYDANSNPIYAGFAYPGVAASEAKWLIQKMTYDGLNRMTLRQVKRDGIWDNRETETYV